MDEFWRLFIDHFYKFLITGILSGSIYFIKKLIIII